MMRRKIYFDIMQSRIRHRLVYSLGIAEIADAMTFSLMMLCLGAGVFLITTGIPTDNVNYTFVAYLILPLVLCFCIYGMFRKLTERRLVGIETTMTRQEIVSILPSFLKQEGYQFEGQNHDVIFATQEEPLSYRRLWTSDLLFLIEDGKVLFNMRKRYPALNPPVVFSHLILKRRLRKFLNKPRHHVSG